MKPEPWAKVEVRGPKMDSSKHYIWAGDGIWRTALGAAVARDVVSQWRYR